MKKVLAIAALVAATATAQETQRPELKLGAAPPYDTKAIPAYRGNHAKVYAHIDANLAAHTAALQRWVRQRSISAQSDGIDAMAEMLRSDLRSLGFKETAVVPTAGHPGVFGYYDAGAPQTIVVYMMYDVQPVEPADWRVPPFDGAIVDHDLGRVLMARGATNQKGPERAFLNALESIIAAEGKLPVNLYVIAEGEEELGSPHMPELVAQYESRLRTATGVLFPMNAQGRAGDVTLNLGVKGIIYMELEARGGDRGGPVRAEVHGSTKALLDSPTWRLVQALASMTSPDGNTIRIRGYYDSIRPMNEEEQRLVNAMVPDWGKLEPQFKQGLDARQWVDNWSGTQSLLHYLFDTTLNIDGLWSGYMGPGTKTILPHVATAKVDSRLVPNQTPDEVEKLIRAHLDRNGFADISIRRLGGYPPAQSSVSSPMVQKAIGVYNKHKLTPAVSPRLAGSAPYYLFTDRLKLPMVAGGIGHGSGAHAPNEYMVIEPKAGSTIAGLAAIEKFYVDLLYAVSK
jgi:acetylornithine deacetylase/succinyl-diaminopimelate desuccinylase-like protein